MTPGSLPALAARPAAADAAADALRRAARRLDAASPSSPASGGAGWSGAAASAAARAAVRWGCDRDAAAAAVRAGASALATYAAALGALEARRAALEDRAAHLRARADGLEGGSPTPDGLGASAALAVDVAAWRRDAAAWAEDVTAAEEALVEALADGGSVPGVGSAVPDPGGLAAGLRGLRGDPAAVRRWWDALDPAERAALTASCPAAVGGTDGVPAAVRDRANRDVLGDDLDRLGAIAPGELTDAERRHLHHARAAAAALDRATGETDPATGAPLAALLLLYRPTAAGGDGLAALALGDPDSAARTAVLVPGIRHDAGSLPGVTDDALALLRDAASDGTSTSTVAWIGYDAPTEDGAADWAGVLDDDAAERGGRHLDGFVAGLRATHDSPGDDPSPAHLTVLGHSYGSTTVAHALADGPADDVDAAVLLGSPGAGRGHDHADDLVGDGDLYVASRDRDPVTWVGDAGPDGGERRLGLGADPAHRDFGATRLDAGDGHPAADRWRDNHDGYYAGPGLGHLGDVVADRPLTPDAVVDGRDRSGAALAVDAAVDAVAHAARDRWDRLRGGLDRMAARLDAA